MNPYWWDLATEYIINEDLSSNVTLTVKEDGQAWTEPEYLQNEDPIVQFTGNRVTEVSIVIYRQLYCFSIFLTD